MARWEIEHVRLENVADRMALDVVVDGYLGDDDAPRLCAELAAVADVVAEVRLCDLRGLVRPDVGTVNALALVRLTTARMGWPLRLGHRADLQELIELLGLGAQFPTCRAATVTPSDQQPGPPRGILRSPRIGDGAAGGGGVVSGSSGGCRCARDDDCEARP